MMLSLLLLLLLIVLSAVATANEPDEHESCGYWAEIGECQKNPSYMLQSCKTSCANHGAGTTASYNSFYEIVETDINGNEIHFSDFEGKVVYLVNVASQCGYTESNYATIKKLVKYKAQGLEVVLAPCNAFGSQEPGSPGDIVDFAHNKGFDGLILSKGEVNGAGTRPSFDFLKSATQKSYIAWNFDGKFLVDRKGLVTSVSNDEDVETHIRKMLVAPAPSSDL